MGSFLDMTISNIAIVGAGVMGEGVINSLLKAGISSRSILINDKCSERVQKLQASYGVNSGSISEADAVFLAVKPQDFETCIEELKVELRDGTLLVSLLAGVRISSIESSVGNRLRVIRVMPNTPLLLGEGMSVITKGRSGSETDLAWVSRMLSNSGKTLVVDEELMDAVTAVSGSGPAYFYGFVEAMIKAAMKLGLTEQDAKLLVHQTLIGAAKMVQESGKDAATLRGEVTSPNGTTAAALNSFHTSGWEDIVYRAIKAAMDRSRELSN
jgi:pyrroline-5-carboxylate reductase